MGLQALEGSWLEGQDALLSTAVGALTFWVLGAIVGLLVCCRGPYNLRDGRPRDRGLMFERHTEQVL